TPKDHTRQLHVHQAVEGIGVDDSAQKLREPKDEVLINHHIFEIQERILNSPRETSPLGQFTIACCLTGSVNCAEVNLRPGEVFLAPATLQERQLKPRSDGTTLLRITIPTAATTPKPKSNPRASADGY